MKKGFFASLVASFVLGATYGSGPPIGDTAAWVVFVLWLLSIVSTVVFVVTIRVRGL